MKMTKKLLLPRIKRKNDEKLEKFIIANINKELKNPKNKDEHFDLMQIQYFFESAFYDRSKIRQLLNKLKVRK